MQLVYAEIELINALDNELAKRNFSDDRVLIQW